MNKHCRIQCQSEACARAMAFGFLILCVVTPLGLTAASAAAAPSSPDPHLTAETESDSDKALSQQAQETMLRLEALEKDNMRLRATLDRMRDDTNFVEARTQRALRLGGKISGYIDFGFFGVTGDGSGLRTDQGNFEFPKYAGQIPGSWVFLGDPLSVAINSRGDPADTGMSRAIVFDPIAAGNNPTYILNTLNLSFFSGIGDDVTLTAVLDILPRGRMVSKPDGLFLGDFLDLKLAYLEYLVPVDFMALSIYAGKFDSVVGYEYRIQESPDRISVTPSLICRYICGHPIGLKARASLLDERVTFNLALTNGTQFTETFGFYDEVDSNMFKTLAGRLSVQAPLGTLFEMGVSGALGAQDGQSENDLHQWHLGADLHMELSHFDISMEYVRGEAPGQTKADESACGVSPCLDYQGAYGLIAYRLSNQLMPYLRVDWRKALHREGASFVYISRLWRATGGLRIELGTHVVVKAEYTHNQEIDMPSFANNVFTSSLVVKL